MNYLGLLERADEYARTIREYRPLKAEEVRELDAYYRIGLTYSSNALEGNSLTITETKVLLEDGLTAGGKPIRDCYEATGHARAYDFMLEAARGGVLSFSEQTIQRLHALFYSGIDPELAGKYRTTQVFITGTNYLPPAPEQVPEQMANLVVELEQAKDRLHPIVLSAVAHKRLVDIHPFQDGNGRTARLLMNLVLVNKGYCVVSIPPILRHDYIAALQKAQREKNPDSSDFIGLICQCEIEAQKDYCRMFRIPSPGQNPMRASQGVSDAEQNKTAPEPEEEYRCR